MRKLYCIIVILMIILSACTVQPQETTAPTETTAPAETTAPTQPTEATQPTEPPTQPTEPPTEPPTQPTEPPTQPTEPTTAPKLNVMEMVPSQPLTTPILLDCDYKISIIDMPYEERLERRWGGSTTLTSLEHANSYTKMYEGRGYDLTVKNALCPQSYTEIRDIFVDEVNVPNEEFFKDYALVEILVTNPEGVLPKIEKIEFCKECVDPMDGWYVRIYVDAEPPSLTDPVYSIWVKVPWTINGIKMEPGAQVGGHYFVYTYLLQ